MTTASIKRAGKSGKIAISAPALRFDSKAFLTSEGPGRSSMKYRPEETVFRQGVLADAVYYIRKGKIRLSVISKHGKEAVIAQLGIGEFFGEGCLAGQTLQLASAIATTASTATKIEMKTMIRTLHEQPKLSDVFIAFLLSRNIRIKADLVDQLFSSSERRLARVLLHLANFGKEGKMEPVLSKISQDTLAAKVGTTRARISFFMKKFKKLGLIAYGGGKTAKSNGLKVHTSLLNVIIHD